MSLQVAVRVRPFNQREKDLNSQLVVEMQNQTTKLIHPDDPKKSKEFTFDYSFWSHDGFDETEEGVYKGNTPLYDDQQDVYDQVGVKILDNAWQGYNCCLFAYGQTGAGKSYSMVGYKPNIGIVPIACKEIFKRINANENENLHFEVYASMQEIYCERVQDLLIPISKRPSGGLQIRQNQTIGFYVDGLTKYPVESYEAIEQIMDDGSKNRTIASTQMNACSSRAHTIITIELNQIEQTEHKKIEKQSIISLVDLAGSEKVGKTGASGDRLKEASKINKSLSCLGLVISTLADAQMGKKVKVPYRDSCLTKILCNALGGNSKTLMICALSPAYDNFEETLSTLRYADQAKKIKNKAIVNESATDKLIRELTTEIEELKKQLQVGGGDMNSNKQVQENIEANAALVNDKMISYDQKVYNNNQKLQEIHFKSVDLTQPHLLYLNEDPQLSKKVQHSLALERTTIGKKTNDNLPDIILNAMGIQKQHAVISHIDKDIFIEPCQQECGDYLFLNGNKVYEKLQLQNEDRLIFGTNSSFLCIIPGGEPRKVVENIDWEFVQEELNSSNNQRKKEEEEELKQQQEEMKKKIQELEEQSKRDKEKLLEESKQKEIELKSKIEELSQQQDKQEAQEKKKELEEQIKLQEQDIQIKLLQQQLENKTKKKEVEDEENQKKNKIKEKNMIQHRLQKMLPRIVEVNLFAKELKRKVFLQAKLTNNSQDSKQKKLIIQVQVFNKEEGTVYYWDINKFSNRYYIIKDLLDRYFETNQIPNLPKSEDPFWDPPEPQAIGQGFLKLLSLAYLMDNPTQITCVSDPGSQGQITLNLIPTDQKGEANLGEDMNDDSEIIDDPSELIGKRLDFLVLIESAKLPTDYKNCFIEYAVWDNEKKEQSYRTKICNDKTQNPIFNHKKHHSFEKVDEQIIEYLKEQNIKFSVFAEEEIQQENLDQTQSAQKQSQHTHENPIEEGDENENDCIHPNELQCQSEYNEKQFHEQVIDQTDQTDQTDQQTVQINQNLVKQQQQLEAKMLHDLKKKQGADGKNKNKKNCTIF